MLNSFLSLQKDSEQDKGHSSGLDQKRSCILSVKTVHKMKWDKVAEQIMLTFAENKHPVFRATSPLSRGTLKSKGGEKLSIHYCVDPGTIETDFRTILSVELSIYGAVADTCEECDSCHDRTGRLVVEGQYNPLFVPSVMKTHIPLTDDPAQQEEDLLQRYKERIEKLSQQNRVSKFCTDAGFLTTAEVGQYFMIKHTDEFSQFTEPVACREYTLPRDESLSEPKGWSRENTKIGPVLEVTTSYQQGKYGVNIRIESMNKDNSHSWVRISHGLKKLVTCFCKPITGQRRTSASSSTKTFPIGERTWTDFEPQEYSLSGYSVSKKLINLLRHGSLPRDNDGAIEFWRQEEDCLLYEFEKTRHWSDEKWKVCLAGGGGNKRRFQYCTDSSGAILYLGALQGHSGRNPIDSFTT